MRSGPSVFGYRPGWVWWLLLVGLIAVGGWLLTREFQRREVNKQYIDERVTHYAGQQDLDVDLVRAVIYVESGGDWKAKSNKGAMGLMQVMPIAKKDVRQRFDLADGDLYDVDYNLQVGTMYLAYLLERFEDDKVLALAAYNMGPTRVAKLKKKHPQLSSQDLVQKHAVKETRKYVEKVLKRYEKK